MNSRYSVNLKSSQGCLPRSVSMPSLNLQSISQQGLLQDLIAAGMASQERPTHMCIRDENASQTNVSASFLRGSTSENLRESEDDFHRGGTDQTKFGNAISHVPTSNVSYLPSVHTPNWPFTSLPSRDREAAALLGLDTSVCPTIADKVADHPVLGDGIKCLQPSMHALQAPPGFSNAKNNADVNPWHMQESLVRRSPSLHSLASYLSSMEPGVSQLSRFGNEALSIQRDPDTDPLGAGVPSMQRVRSMGCIENEKVSLSRVPSKAISGSEVSTMRRSPSSGTFTNDFVSKKTPSFEDFAGLSFFGTPGSGTTLSSQQHEQLTFIPEVTRDRENTELNHWEQKKQLAVDHNVYEASPFIAGERVVHNRGGTQTCNIPQGHSSEPHNTIEIFDQVLQKRLEHLELENNLLIQLLHDQLLRRRAEDCPMSLSSNTAKHAVCDTVCRYYNLGKCIRGDACPFLHPHKRAGTGDPLVDKTAMRTQYCGAGLKVMSCNEGQRGRNDEGLVHLGCDTRTRLVKSHQATSAENFCALRPPRAQSMATSGGPLQGIIMSLDDLQGHMYIASKDPHLSRFLQAKVTEGKSEDVERIFQEIIKDDVVHLMMDPYANYLVQKLVEVCSSAQYNRILDALCKHGNLVTLSLSAHGTRVIQKLIKRLETREQRCSVVFLLQRDTVRLSKDPSGNHVVQKCIQYVGNEDCQSMYDAVLSHCEEIASDRYGCLVLQRCLDFGSISQRKQLIDMISANATLLAQHPFGNYGVQYVFDLNLTWASKGVILKLKGKFAELSMQKCSSNVVQKCLKVADEDDLACIVKELIETSAFNRMLDHPFANYVIQSALGVTKGALHSSLVQAILPHINDLRSSAYGKRILSCSYMRPESTKRFSVWE